MRLTARKIIPAQVLVYIILFQSQRPLQVDTHFIDAETDSMPAQRSLVSIHTQHQPTQVNLVGMAR